MGEKGEIVLYQPDGKVRLEVWVDGELDLKVVCANFAHAIPPLNVEKVYF